jgi:hypothetical protein
MYAIAIKTGLAMLAGFICLFLPMTLVGLGDRSELRLLNGVIHVYFMYQGIKAFRALYPADRNNYILCAAQGIMASLIGILGFAFFMMAFLSFNPSMMDSIQAANPTISIYLNPFSASLFIITEGVIVSLFGSYLITRYLSTQGVKVVKKSA